MGYKSGEIYFIREKSTSDNEFTPWVKIGLVTDGRKGGSFGRLLEHQTANPRNLSLNESHIIPTDAVTAVEAQLHRRFASKRVRNEWFKFDTQDELDMAIREARSLATEMSDVAPIFGEMESLSNRIDNGKIVSPDVSSIEVARRLVRAKIYVKICADAEKTLKKALEAALSKGEDVQGVAKEASIEVKAKFNRSEFETDYPDLFQEFSVVSKKTIQRFLIDTKFRKNTSATIQDQIDLFSDRIEQITATGETFAAEGQFQMMQDSILQLTKEKALADWDRSIDEAKLKVACAENHELEGLCTWRREEKPEKKFDEKAFQLKHPDMFSDYLSDPETKKFIRLSRTYGK